MSCPNNSSEPHDGCPQTVNQTYTADHCAMNDQKVNMTIIINTAALRREGQNLHPAQKQATEQAHAPAQTQAQTQPPQTSTEVLSQRGINGRQVRSINLVPICE
jgi:hypothetical protein